MSDRDRLLDTAIRCGLIALILIWCAVGAALLGYHEDEGGNGPAGAYNHAQHASNETRDTAPPRGVIQTPPRDPNPDRKEWRDESDLEAQWKAADWTFWGTLVAALGAVVALVGVIFVARTLRLQFDANEQAREFFIEERRAWLDLSVTATSWTASHGRAIFQVVAKAKNVGHMPATNVYFYIPGDGVRGFAGDDVDGLKKLLEFHKANWVHELGDTIFPSGERPRGAKVGIPLLQPDLLEGDFYVPVFVSYRYAGSDETHVTCIVQHILFAHHQATNTFRIWEEAHFLGLPPD